MNKKSDSLTKFSGVSCVFSPYQAVVTEAQSVDKTVVDDMVDLYGLRPGTKKQEMRELKRNRIDVPNIYNDEDLQCAARFPQFSNMSKDEVLDLAEMVGINTKNITKVRACHELHQMGIDTEHKVHSVLVSLSNPSSKPIGSNINLSWNPSTLDTTSYQCELPIRIPSIGSCGRVVDGGRRAPGFTDKVYSTVDDCQSKCIYTDNQVNNISVEELEDLLKTAQKVPKVLSSTFGSENEGRKCRRSKVDGRKRDKKGRFCKKSKKMMKRK